MRVASSFPKFQEMLGNVASFAKLKSLKAPRSRSRSTISSSKIWSCDTEAPTSGTTLRHAPGFAYAVQKDAYVDLTFGNDVPRSHQTWNPSLRTSLIFPGRFDDFTRLGDEFTWCQGCEH